MCSPPPELGPYGPVEFLYHVLAKRCQGARGSIGPAEQCQELPVYQPLGGSPTRIGRRGSSKWIAHGCQDILPGVGGGGTKLRQVSAAVATTMSAPPCDSSLVSQGPAN